MKTIFARTVVIRALMGLAGAAVCMQYGARPVLAGPPNCAGAGLVVREAKVSSTAGGFAGPLNNGDNFGIGIANIGDLDGDGVTDLASGTWHDDDGGTDRGAVWILRMNADGTVKASQKISDLAGGLAATLDNNDSLGVNVAALGDLDHDQIPDIAVSAPNDDDGGTDRGAIYVLFLNADGTVKAEQKISATTGGFTGVLDNTDGFGVGLGAIGDLDNDGVTDLAAGPWLDDDGGPDRGAVYILFLNADGTVKANQKISDIAGGFNGVLNNADHFGRHVVGIGDLDRDSVLDIVVGADFDDNGGTQTGALYVLFMNSNGTVKAEQKITGQSIGAGFDQFGVGFSSLGDLDGDGIVDLGVGAFLDDDGGNDKGAAWILFMNTDGTVRATQKISDLAGNFNGVLDFSDVFGSSVAGLGDLDNDCYPDIAISAFQDDDGGIDRGAIWILSLSGCLPREICCPGNADRIGGVTFSDITDVLTNFGIPGSPCVQNPGDADCNGLVNFADITAVLTNFNASCP